MLTYMEMLSCSFGRQFLNAGKTGKAALVSITNNS